MSSSRGYSQPGTTFASPASSALVVRFLTAEPLENGHMNPTTHKQIVGSCYITGGSAGGSVVVSRGGMGVGGRLRREWVYICL